MKIELIRRDQTQYKANLHCHSTVSDGHKTPKELIDLYRAAGYSVLAITDHEVPNSHFGKSTEDFLLLTGYECYIRVDPSAVYDIYQPEVHLNLFPRDPANETFICYNPNYAKYIRRIRPIEELKRAGSERTREYNRAYVQEYIDTAIANGYLVAYNHAYWSMEAEADILSYNGCFSMEIRNGGSDLSNGIEYNAQLYDKMLLSGKRIFCHAGDDNHNSHPVEDPRSDSFLAWTYIMADSLTHADVIGAMERGDMYASSGPKIHALSVEDHRVHIECSPAKHIYVYTGSKAPKCLHAAEGETVTVADLTVDARAKYIRVSVFDAERNTADTRGYFPDELGWEATR